MSLRKTLARIESEPKKLFLIDGAGALLSAFLLGVVLVRFESVFGIPSSTLYFLAALPVFFALYDLYCYQKKNAKLDQLLKGIALINVLYCCLSIGFAFYHTETIMPFGWVYIIGEVFIVISLAMIELRIAKGLISKR